MNTYNRYRIALLFFALVFWVAKVSAQDYVFRYVSLNGEFSNGGTSWTDAKNNLQSAIDELYEEIRGTSKVGYVFVAGEDDDDGMTYVPTRRSTDEADGSAFNTSFRMYSGIHVFGGFKGDELPDDPDHPELLPQQRIMTNGHTYAHVESDIDADNIGQTVRRWNFKYKTILSGNHSTSAFHFQFDENRGIYSTIFPMSSYHVVWFGTNGKITPTADGEGSLIGHYAALSSTAAIDGCTIEGGYASSTNLKGHDHTGYGGGVYMVKGAVLRNCVVHHCSAMQRGGAVYMDGGGEVERCYIHTSQTTGYGMQQGYGGGVCIDYDGAVKHSYIIQCAARIGAGLAICHVPNEYPERTVYPDEADRATPYDPYTLSTVIANCTSNAEGAGVYLDEGGTLNHCSVVNNKCIGPDVIYYGRRHGRTGGIYVRNGGTVYNSVAWGNECAVNNDVQFAAFKNGTKDINVYHSAFSKGDITDWAAVTKEAVISLEDANFPSPEYHSGNFPMFKQPTINAGIQALASGAVDPTDTADGHPYQRVYNWHPLAVSDLRAKAVQVTDAVDGFTDDILHAHTDVDVVGRHFESVSSCGALAHSYRNIQFALLPSQEKVEGRLPDETTYLPTLFVDPSLVTAGAHNDGTYTGFLDEEPMGDSWTHPMINLSDAIYFFKQYLHDGKRTESDPITNTYYEINGTRYPYVQILVKQGKMTVAGQGAYVSGYARTASIRPGSNMRLYGAFPSTNTGTAQDERNPFDYNSDISANILDGGYESNSVHVVAIANQHDVIVDGFRLYGGNANISPEPTDPNNVEVWTMYTSLADGAGIVVNNAMSTPAMRRDMTGNILRNVVISNCAAPEGAAVYVSGGYDHGTENRLCKAELTMVNVIVRNCTAGDIWGNPDKFVGVNGTFSNKGVLVANGEGRLTLRNCDVVNNCGFPFRTDTVDVSGVKHIGRIKLYNSVVFSNGLKIRDDRNGITRSTFATFESFPYIDGDNVYIDYDALISIPQPAIPDLPDMSEKFIRILTRDKSQNGTMQPTRYMISTTEIYQNGPPVKVFYPSFVNPSRNVGHSEGDDQSYYGGRINYEPLPTNPLVNAGKHPLDSGTGQEAWDNLTVNVPSMSYDMGMRSRDYGGDPDLGAIETMRLPKAGTVLYVTPDGAGRRDGSSWANAIAGNTVYMLDNVEGPALASGDQIDSEPTCDRILDSNGDPVLTTDDKYCGGFGRVWLNSYNINTTINTTYNDYVTEKNIYVGGVDDGTENTLRTDDYESSVGTVSTSSPVDGFSVGYNYDPRYPYGEISGQSRTFWRANPYTGSYNNKNSFIAAENTNGFINNTRSERYVGGLQYAVERAAAYNALPANDAGRIDGVDAVQVWISNGKYTDYKGFIMRDKTTVMGSFPAKDEGTPGLTERQALMSAVVDIPKSLPAQDLDPENYETILQISDTNPKQDNLTLNPDAVKFWDDEWSLEQTVTTNREITSNRSITHTYTWNGSASDVNITDDYYLYSTFKDNDITSETADGDTHTLKFGTATDAKDCWHLTYTGNKSTSGSNGVIGRYETNQMSGEPGAKIYENGNYTNEQAGQRLWLRNGTLTGVNLWQDMKNVPAGNYKIVVDLNAFYRDGTNVKQSNIPTGVKFIVKNSAGTTVVEEAIMAKSGSRTLARTELNRYTFNSINQPANGTLSIRIEVGEFDNTKGNNREVEMANFKLIWVRPAGYYETATTDVRTTRDGTEEVENTTTTITATVDTHRTTLRKRVLTMPDVCVPTYGGGGIGNPVTHEKSFNDELPHTDRVTGDAKSQRTATTYDKQEDPHYVGYTDVYWDGFTIRHGFLYDEAMTHGGGAGVNMYEGAHLQNCVVINNFAASQRNKGGGIFCDGATSTIEGCFVLNNTSTRGTTDTASEYKQVFAGGMFLYEGTCFNSLFAKNHSFGSAGGVGFCVGRFYNNTIAYNTCSLVEGGHINGGAISLATISNPNLFIANTIIYGNSGMAIRQRYDTNVNINAVNPFIHCYVQTEVAFTQDLYKKNIGNHSDNSNYWGIGNVLFNGELPTSANTPFKADLDAGDGSYTGGAATHNDFRLASENPFCINKGTEDFAGALYSVLQWKRKWDDATIRSQFLYQIVEASELPDNDVAFADRIQDCQIDIGAYEFDGTRDIEPSLFPNENPKKAIFYVTQNGYGMATAENPVNAACFLKFQKVLDAAGRWRYASYFYANADSIDAGAQKKNNFDEAMLSQELVDALERQIRAEHPNWNNTQVANAVASQKDAFLAEQLPQLKDYEVIIRLEGENGTGFSYIPTRSTNLNTESVNEMEKSLIVPHGIRIEGGYEYTFTEDRDILGRRTNFSGEVDNETLGTRGNVYHVITFTNDLFDINENIINEGCQLQFLGDKTRFENNQTKVEDNRTVLDGIFIQDGNANGTSTAHQCGAGAVVTDYAHIRNCVILNNSASKYGGGLYLMPQALVSGCIVKNNSAMQGGGLYVEEPEQNVSSETFVHIISTTVVDNSATMNAGGLWFLTNVRVNSSAFWRNTASNFGNVSGVFATGLTQIVENYPMNYCGVGSNRVAGVNNIELPTVAEEGVRWDPTMPYELGFGQESVYFPITVSSVLGRAGMTYAAYEDFRNIYPTLELADIFGLNRMAQIADEDMTLADGSTYTKVAKNNAFIEMGARVMNGNFEVQLEFAHVLKRLFVTTTERLPTEKALTLQQNTVEAEWARRYPSDPLPSNHSDSRYVEVENDVETYKQMGSSFLNPFHRFGDALEYIIKVRKEMSEMYDMNHTIGQHFKDERFEIFVCGGTFHPFRDAHGNQGEARSNTFVVPEEVTIVGGVNHEADGHAYCQETTGTLSVAGYDLNPATTYEIRAARDHMDRNGNHVKEPWEMTEQTILDGNAVTGDMKTNVYHVITCFADKNQVGQLPTRRDENNDEIEDQNFITPSTGELLGEIEKESRESRDKRTIILDGLTITGGHAHDIEDEEEADNYLKLTYFRGGGILVDGNWDDSFDTTADLPEVLGVAQRNIPLMMTACTIRDNEAANGGGVYTNGTFYAFSCHFTKNLAQGPMSLNDQKYIPWSAGGAIANNYEVHLWNSLFANNEAEKGNYDIIESPTPMRYEGEKPITNPVENANARQGYGGSIACTETGLARICNCDFVRNKAVAFPALYNFFDNNLRAASSALSPTDAHYYGKGHHFAVNSIFWGNEATAETVSLATGWEKEYYTSLYPASPSEPFIDRRKPWHVANFAPMLDIATLTFCSYEEGTGREGTVWWTNQDNAKSAPIEDKNGVDGLTRLYAGDFVDVLDDYFGYYPDGFPETPYYKLNQDGTKQIPCALTDPALMYEGNPKTLTDEEQKMAVPYNYNLVLASENIVPGGPYFVQPSLTAGVDGYMENADWLVARLNNSVDTGWGFLKQDVTMQSASSSLYNTTLLDKDMNPVTPTTDQYAELYGDGFYNLHSKNIHQRFRDFGYPNLLPIGDEYYMEYSRDGEAEAANMRRISTHPKMGVQDVYIDMGIYEYQYVQLVTPGDQMDVIWVSETQDPNEVCDGSTWAKATSDLQGAIETLLLSRNDHDKMIKLKGGTYSPTRMTQDNQKAFFVNVPSRQDGVLLPEVVNADETHLVKSLTFRGGYPTIGIPDPLDNFEKDRDTERYPVTFSMVYEKGNIDKQLEHLFIIEDAEQKGTYVNYMTAGNYDFKDKVMPIVFDGITFYNPYGHSHNEGGAALYYREQYQTVSDGNINGFTKDRTSLLKAAGEGIPKLLVKDCVFAANGAHYGVSAVNIEKGGGEALFVNTLFHSNSGNPIDAVNTKLVNCTFARNGGHLNLTNVTEQYKDGTSVNTFASGVYNSIIWMDDEGQTEPSQKKMWEGDIDMGTAVQNVGPNDDRNMKYNAFTEWWQNPNTGVWEWWYPKGVNIIYGTGNIRLSPENDDVLYGPSFIDPEGEEPAEGTAEEKLLAKKLSRNFRLSVSARTVNQANWPTYRDLVPYYAETRTQEQKIGKDADDNNVTYYFHSVQRDDRTQLTEAQLRGTDASDPPYTEYELAYKPRWNGDGIDRGAYECTAAMERVLYVMDSPPGRQDGTTWEHAFDIEDLQKAINVASVYSLTSASRERAYVFVKATDVPLDALRLRDGVSVYGSINYTFLEEVEKQGGIYQDAAIASYINKVRAVREGIATKGMDHNTVKGLISDNSSDHTSGFLLDGFWITSGSTDDTPVQMNKAGTVLINDVIAGCSVTEAGKPVVDVDNGLLYNALLYDNSVTGTGTAVVNVGTDGYVLNCTVAPVSGQTGMSGQTNSTHVLNTIDATTSTAMFAPYFRPLAEGGNTGYQTTLPDYLTEHHPYWYQLHEQSKEIDAGTDDKNQSLKDGDNAIAKLFPAYVDFSLDRDVLGNPRRLRGRVDNGCFETWKITDDKLVTNMTNAAYTSYYGGHFYPHLGSVLYLDENANLVVDWNQTDDAPRFTAANALLPGYVLVKKGASIYGQGNTLRFSYVAAEKEYTDQQYALTAFPFGYDVQDALTTSYTSATDRLAQTNAYTFAAHTYDGATRAAWNYDFKENNSDCWQAATTVEANEGWLLNFGNAATKTLRFTGWADTEGTYNYSEEGTDKVVELTQYNSSEVGRNPNGASDYPSFTKKENMGWNMKGQPWLVTTFATDGTNPNFKMDVPHLFYSMNTADGSYKNAQGQIYTTRSWQAGAQMNLGEAFFTQTAIIGTKEQLTFKLPVYSGNPPVAEAPARRLVAVSDNSQHADYIELSPQPDAEAQLAYRLGSDGVKWFALSDHLPALYMLTAEGTPLSLLSAAPVETDIPLGLRTPYGGAYTFHLPSTEAFADYQHVWLTDHETGTVTDLMEQPYTLTAETVGHDTDRLTLRIGGMRPEVENHADHSYLIYTRGHRLFVKNLALGDLITIYTVDGIQLYRSTATSSQYEHTLPDGIYVVRVNHAVKKVIVK